MSTYLFNNKRDRETNKLMGVVIFLILSLVFTIVVSLSIFLFYFDDYMDIQEQYKLLEEKLQKVRIENYEKNSDYTRLNVELNQIKNEVNKLNLEKEISDKNIKIVENFIGFVNKGNIKESNKFLDPDRKNEFLLMKNQKFPNEMESGDFILNDNLESGTVTYFHTEEDSRTDKYVFNMVLKDDDWFISNLEIVENNLELEALLN